MQKREKDLPSNEEVNVPLTDAIAVLSDNQWHMAETHSTATMRSDNYDPVPLNVYGTVDVPLHARQEIPSEESLYPVEFLRNQGSWGREGDALSCAGLARTNGKEIPTRLFVWDEGGGTGIFLHSIDNSQSNTRR